MEFSIESMKVTFSTIALKEQRVKFALACLNSVKLKLLFILSDSIHCCSHSPHAD